MGLFSKLLGKKENTNTPSEYREAIAFNQEFEALKPVDKFIARIL